MSKILVAGLVNVETTVKIDTFPIPYMPIQYPFHGIHTEVSGSGLNIGKALTILGDKVDLLSMTGKDEMSMFVKDTLKENHMKEETVLPLLQKTPQSVILYDESGKRQIFCDLKEIQETAYDAEVFKEKISSNDILILNNINFVRPFLESGKKAGKKIVTNVHNLSDIHDTFNEDFMKYADILFLSDENIIGNTEEFVHQLESEYQNEIIIVGRGAKGALLYVKEDQFIGSFPAVKTRKVVSTAGAGDSLLSGFIHFYHKTGNPYYSLKCAILFASYKIGTASSAYGFLAEEQLEQYYSIIWRDKGII